MIEESVKEKLGPRIIKWQKKNEERYYIEIKKEDLEESAKILFNDFGMRLSTASGVDTLDGFEILYHFSCDREGKFFSLKVKLDRENPEVPSISNIVKGAKWIEREISELLGINFKGHPEPKRLLLTEDWSKDVFPLRKDFKDEQKPKEPD